MTIYDHIKTLSLKELAKFLNDEIPACIMEKQDCTFALEYWLSSYKEEQEG